MIRGREACWASVVCLVVLMEKSGLPVPIMLWWAHYDTLCVCGDRSDGALHHCHHHPHVLNWIATKCWPHKGRVAVISF